MNIFQVVMGSGNGKLKSVRTTLEWESAGRERLEREGKC